MVDVDAMSDAELRTKLIEYGFPVMPITGTTRKVMVKKLKLLIENKSSKSASERRSLAQFSSEDESDSDQRSNSKREQKNRRVTMAVVPPMQPPATNKVSTRKSTRRNDENDILEDSKVSSVNVTKRNSRTTKIINLVNDQDTNSDSEPDIVETDYKISPRNNFTRKASPVKSPISSSSYSYTSSPPKAYSSPKQQEVLSPRSYLNSSPSRYSTYNSPSAVEDKLNQIRSRLSLGNSNIETSVYSTTTEANSENPPTPFLSNFTKRLSQLSSNRPELDLKSDVIKEHDSNGAGGYNRTYFTRPKQRDYSRDYQANQDGNSKGNYISFLLVGCAVLFFIIVMALYWGMHSGNNNNEIIGLVVPYCEKHVTPKKHENCLLADDLQGAVDIYRVIKPELIKAAIGNLCEDRNIKPYMTEDDIVQFVKNNYALQDAFTITQDLNNFVILLFKNSFWEVSVLQSRDDNFSEDSLVNNLETIMSNKKNNYTTAFAVLNPSLPFSCSAYLKFSAVFQTLMIIMMLCAVPYLFNYIYRYYKYYQQRKKDEIILMVEKILDLLQTNASDDGDNYLVINHVRDMIIPIDNRKKMEKTWQMAVEFINENESRVRTEVQVVKGEPYEVWRWLGGVNTSAARNKSWQGQAFETQIGSVNSPPCSPTPCLKIRGMVEDGDRNLHTIREAVLVKCAEQCKILHCAVDVHSKCVYLKCADHNDAAIAYRNLHGWWYASHLVTVKYLRLERYMQRFPDSPTNGPPFLKAHQIV